MEEIGKVVKVCMEKIKTWYTYSSVRKPGFVYEFQFMIDNSYRCPVVETAGKNAIIAIVSDEVSASSKHPAYRWAVKLSLYLSKYLNVGVDLCRLCALCQFIYSDFAIMPLLSVKMLTVNSW